MTTSTLKTTDLQLLFPGDGDMARRCRAFDWEREAAAIRRLTGDKPLIVAGGLAPDNVAAATFYRRLGYRGPWRRQVLRRGSHLAVEEEFHKRLRGAAPHPR